MYRHSGKSALYSYQEGRGGHCFNSLEARISGNLDVRCRTATEMFGFGVCVCHQTARAEGKKTTR